MKKLNNCSYKVFNHWNNGKKENALNKYSIKFNRPTSKKEAVKFYYENLERSCHCSHDCCGHWFSVLSGLTRKTTSKFEFSIGLSRNF